MLTILVKHSTLDFWQSSEYASVICYSLFGEIMDEDAHKIEDDNEDANKIDSVAM